MPNLQLIARINRADRETLMEAARFLARPMAGDSSRFPEAKQLVSPLSESPFTHVPEIEALARAVLIAAAQNPDLEAKVSGALDGADRKQFVLTGAEIVMLAAIGTVALQLLTRKGQGVVTKTTTINTTADGVTVVFEEKTEPLSIGGELGALLKTFFAKG